MTDSDKALLDFLKWCKHPPTVRDIQLWGGYSNLSKVFEALDRLEAEGHISRRHNRNRAIGVKRQ